MDGMQAMDTNASHNLLKESARILLSKLGLSGSKDKHSARRLGSTRDTAYDQKKGSALPDVRARVLGAHECNAPAQRYQFDQGQYSQQAHVLNGIPEPTAELRPVSPAHQWSNVPLEPAGAGGSSCAGSSGYRPSNSSSVGDGLGPQHSWGTGTRNSDAGHHEISVPRHSASNVPAHPHAQHHSAEPSGTGGGSGAASFGSAGMPRLRVHTSRRAAAEERVACTGAAATGPGGAATSSTAGGPPPPAAPPVPRLDLSRLQDEATEASRSRHRRYSSAACPLTPPAGPPGVQPTSHGAAPAPAAVASPLGPLGPLGLGALPQLSDLELDRLDAEVDMEGWAEVPNWQPANQGKWYVYPPISRQDAAPIEALVGSLTPRRAHTVVGLWRRYAAARYSTELMAGRATRLVKELTRELADTRAEACEVQRQMEVQVHHLNHVVAQLQHELQQARQAAASATAAATAAGAMHTPGRGPHSHPRHPPSTSDWPGADASPTRHRATLQNHPTTHTTPGGAAGGLMDSTTASSAGPSPYWTQQQQHRGDVGELSPEQMLRQQQQQLEAQQEAATDALRELAGENAELYARLDQMYQLFHEADDDSRALRDALHAAASHNAALQERGDSMRRRAAAVGAENEALRREVAQLRSLLLEPLEAVQREEREQQEQERQHQQHGHSHSHQHESGKDSGHQRGVGSDKGLPPAAGVGAGRGGCGLRSGPREVHEWYQEVQAVLSGRVSGDGGRPSGSGPCSRQGSRASGRGQLVAGEDGEGMGGDGVRGRGQQQQLGRSASASATCSASHGSVRAPPLLPAISEVCLRDRGSGSSSTLPALREAPGSGNGGHASGVTAGAGAGRGSQPASRRNSANGGGVHAAQVHALSQALAEGLGNDGVVVRVEASPAGKRLPPVHGAVAAGVGGGGGGGGGSSGVGRLPQSSSFRQRLEAQLAMQQGHA